MISQTWNIINIIERRLKFLLEKEKVCALCVSWLMCECNRSTGDTYSSMGPDIFRGSCTPILWFVFPIGLRLFTIRYFCHFIVPLKNFSPIRRRHHCRWRAAKFRPMLGAQGLSAQRDLYRATPTGTVTRDLEFSSLIRRTALLSRLLRHAFGCGGPILTRILMGLWHWHYNNGLSVDNKRVLLFFLRNGVHLRFHYQLVPLQPN
jgi:hypothetical protein